MPANMAPTIIGVDGSSGSQLALRWALQDAALGSVPVRLVCCYRRPITLSWEGAGPNDADREADAAQQFAQETVAKALELAGELAPELDVAGYAVYGHAADVLVERSASASQVVVGSRQLKGLGSELLGSVGAGLAARAVCAVVVVRGPSGLPAEHPAKSPPARWFSVASARIERAELPVHRNNTLNVSLLMSIP